MGATCVNCHNTHPESPKRDWKVGDVRGIQEVAISQPIAANLFSFKYLLIYFAVIGTAGFSFLVLQRRHAVVIQGMNRRLEEASKQGDKFDHAQQGRHGTWLGHLKANHRAARRTHLGGVEPRSGLDLRIHASRHGRRAGAAGMKNGGNRAS
jgi:uncharacterized protein DUF3365